MTGQPTDRPDWEAKALTAAQAMHNDPEWCGCRACRGTTKAILAGIRIGLEAARKAMNEASIEVIAGLTDHPEKRLLAACLLNDSIRALLPEEKP